MGSQFNRAAIAISLLAVALYGQPLPPQPQFEVATIKPAPPLTPAIVSSGRMHVGMRMDRALVDIGYSSLRDLLCVAFDVKPYQITGPPWLAQDKWDILAKLPEGASSRDVPKMLQALLSERFGMKAHVSESPQRAYALEVARNGPKLKEAAEIRGPAAGNGDKEPLQVRTNSQGTAATVSGGLAGTTNTEMRPDGSMHYVSTKMTMAQLADVMSAYMDNPVIDMTQLKGRYLIELDFSQEDLRNAAAKAGGGAYYAQATAAAEPGMSLLASVQSLGLRLEKRQLSILMVTVDHLEKSPVSE